MELVKSISIENFLNRRKAIIDKIIQARELILEANKLMELNNLKDIKEILYIRKLDNKYREIVRNFLSEEGLAFFIKIIDGKGWEYLLREANILTFMDAETREEWQKALRTGNFPELTQEVVEETFKQLREDRFKMFEAGIIEVFQKLSFDFKTNQFLEFQDKLILNSLVNYDKRNKWLWFHENTCNHLNDLLRVMSILDNKPEPDSGREGFYKILNKHDKEWRYENEYFIIKWFQKGTAHLKFKRMDLVEGMNKILRKHLLMPVGIEGVKQV